MFKAAFLLPVHHPHHPTNSQTPLGEHSDVSSKYGDTTHRTANEVCITLGLKFAIWPDQKMGLNWSAPMVIQGTRYICGIILASNRLQTQLESLIDCCI
jgi:hypothetical protein